MNRGREILVGAVILAGLTVGVVGTLWLEGINWGRPSRAVEVLLTDVAQLSEGNAVKYRGVQIGRVADIAVEPSGTAVRVFLQLEGEVVIPPDAVVLMAPESFFGDWQAEISARQRYPAFGFFEVPESELARDTLVLGGYALPELSRLTASAEQISDNLASLTNRLELAFNEETAQNLAGAIDNIQAVSVQLRDLVEQQSELAVSVTTRADSALAEIEAASAVARRSFERVESLLTDAQVDSILTNVRAATRDIQQVAEDLSGSTGGLPGTIERADSAFARLDRISARVAAGEGTLGRLLADSTLAFRAEGALEQLDLLLRDLRENPRRYVRLSIF